MNKLLITSLLALTPTLLLQADRILVETESFSDHGGWKLDTQFIREMGSPYLLAHGLGTPVKDATTTIEIKEGGAYQLFARTKDWVARWGGKGQPGRFQIIINGTPAKATFGTKGAEWDWQGGGKISLKKGKNTLALRDLTGFNGRCDAIYLTTFKEVPPNDSGILPDWRRELLGLPEKSLEKDYDLVVIGGGYSGMGAAISGARMGCKVALIQDRPVLGGNGSSEVRVWAKGNIRRGKYPRIGEIIEEISDKAKKSPGTYEEFEDAKKERIVRAEKNIDLLLNHHAFKVEASKTRIEAVHAFNTRTGETTRFTGKFFVDGTGHGTIGFLAGADHTMTPKGRMGMSNMWAWANEEKAVDFPKTSWALDLNMADFPYPRAFHGQWFWESGYDKDALGDAEGIRDWNLRAVFGAFNAMKNRDGADKHKNATLTWVAYVGGPRESRRLLGDVVLTEEDVVSKRDFPDGCVPSTWSIDLHYPKEQYAKKFPDNPFISYAVHGKGVDRSYGYPVPYRCFYSRNIENLFMAGRCISVTHKALGTVRVMKTCGMMGEVVGRAASICIKRGCLPRDVYKSYLDDLIELINLPGKAFRPTVNDKITIPSDAMALAGAHGAPSGLSVSKFPGIVLDDKQAKIEGKWGKGQGLKPYFGFGYRYSSDPNGSATFTFKAPKPGKYDARISYQPHENRGKSVPVEIKAGDQTRQATINMTKKAPLKNGFHSLGILDLKKDQKVTIRLSAKGAKGNVHVDAAQLLPVD
ncbi:MAG: FAD-dependent oxidoreductase [Opitutae bacterium]|nr:FAD-dependent oxidoreductase [Opitutae bacterium]